MDNFERAGEIFRQINIELPILLRKISNTQDENERERLREQYRFFVELLHLIQTDLQDPQMNDFYRRTN